jgi:HAD superfamily phosphatase (TIGR01668 family)
VLSAEVTAWIEALKKQGLKLCLLSNNWHKAVFSYADQLAVPIVYKAMKPAPFAFMRACKKAGRVAGEKVVMVGDQVVTDVWGAHLFGAHIILVEPQAVKDLWYTLLFRRFEKWLLRDMKPRM